MTFEQWDVVLALFPFSERVRSKLRPVVVLSDRNYNEAYNLAIVGMITSAGATQLKADYVITDLSSAGLRHASVARMKLATLAPNLMSRRIGTFAEDDRIGASKVLASIIPLRVKRRR